MTAQDIESFDLDEYRRERAAGLERENEFLKAELDRLYTLLAESLRVATAGTKVHPTALLSVIADMIGTTLSVGAWVEARERCEAKLLLERTIRVLQETR